MADKLIGSFHFLLTRCSRRMLRLRQRNGTGNRKGAIFLFNWSSQYHIYIAKYLYTSRDDWFENLGEIAVLA